MKLMKLAATVAAVLTIASCSSKRTAGIASMAGEWRIVSADGVQYGNNTEVQPTIWFDTKESLVHGNAGCNTFNGSYQTTGQQLRFADDMAVTLKLCNNQEFEQRLLQSLGEVRSFGLLPDGKAELLDDNGKPLVTLAR